LERDAEQTPPLVPAPRHLRRRRLHEDIPDILLVPGAEPVPLKEPPAEAPARAAPDAADSDPARQDALNADTAVLDKEAQLLSRDMLHRRKRRVALLAALVVVLAVLALVLALLLG